MRTKNTKKYIQDDPSKPITTNMREKETDNHKNTIDRVLEKAITRNFCFKNVRQTDRVGI